MRFNVEVTETTQFIVEIEASSEEEAISIVQENYENGEVIADCCANNFTEFNIFMEE